MCGGEDLAGNFRFHLPACLPPMTMHHESMVCHIYLSLYYLPRPNNVNVSTRTSPVCLPKTTTTVALPSFIRLVFAGIRPWRNLDSDDAVALSQSPTSPFYIVFIIIIAILL
jgi:hypothetical protein